MKVAIFLGSDSDKTNMEKAEKLLEKFNVDYISYIISAHRLPDQLINTIKKVENKKTDVIIAGAGLSAHLPGIISSRTIIPVIGVPLYCKNNYGSLGGLDSLFSIVQMPQGVPVATVGINNSYNAALLSIHILSIKYPHIKKLLVKFRTDLQYQLTTKIKNQY
ncbi:5-(carboxyamino)imidazole ribonucleotide mutase [Blattabacterium cuenoti]|uniref:5-(carboxyamino)imidazole ribonucleotide mutase n=1 Tax=Blattabacterium cuenoti TaxID=1653831 RepID=UPI00163C21D6|nr:5-(carboxyamino)imidazole ribonucleotide mutase [Blattabacterium cuenoti]